MNSCDVSFVTPSNPTIKGASNVQRFNSKLVGVLIALAVIGVLSSIPLMPTILKAVPADQLILVIFASSIQALVLMALAAALGAWLAPKVGFGAPALTAWLEKRSPGSILQEQAKVGFPVGMGIGVATVALEALVFRKYIPADLYLLQTKESLTELMSSVLYGGIGEEILLRWGFMSLMVWLASFVFRKRAGESVHPVALWTGIIVAAVAFGAGHLPAVMAMVGHLDAGLVARTIVLNAGAAIGFGYVYYRKGLESAMFAHMGAHLAFFVLRFIFGA